MNQVVTPNATYLNSLTVENFGTLFSFSNQSFRTFFNILIQWLLLDYNQDFVNSVLDVLIRSFSRDDFFTYTDPFNIILFELNAEISKKRNPNTEDPNVLDVDIEELKELNKNISLLMIILEVLTTIPSISNYLRLYFQNDQKKQVFKDYSTSIICILQELKKLDIHRNQDVRNIISRSF